MAKQIPGVMETFGHSVLDSDWTNFGKGPKLRPTSGTPLQPHNEWHSLRYDHNIPPKCPEEIIEHSSLALGEVPINLMKAYP